MYSIKDVAKKAGVSIGTVSNVINNTRYVSPELSKRVHKAIKELGYSINPIASGLKSMRTRTIGLVATDITRVFYSHVITGMQRAANENNYILSIYSTYNSLEAEKEAIERYRMGMIDAIILDTSANITDMDYFVGLSNLKFKDKFIPIMSIELDLSQYGISSIFVNNMLASENATEYLIEKGCKNIVHILGPESSSLSRERLIGYKKAIVNSDRKIDEEYVIKGDFSHYSGYHSIEDFIKKGIPFDGVFAANDQMAIGASEAIRNYGLKIPEDVKVVGFDDSFIASLVSPSLTTINVPKEEMGYRAVSELINLLNTEEPQTVSICLDAELVQRNSTEKNVLIERKNYNW